LRWYVCRSLFQPPLNKTGSPCGCTYLGVALPHLAPQEVQLALGGLELAHSCASPCRAVSERVLGVSMGWMVGAGWQVGATKASLQQGR
jgi:hypothetical protein